MTRPSPREVERRLNALDEQQRAAAGADLSAEQARDIRAADQWFRACDVHASCEQLATLLEHAYRDGVAVGDIDDADFDTVGMDLEGDR